jgi:Lambda phage tail tube protein, TTP
MAASQAISGFGAALKIGDGGGSEVFTTVAEVRQITGPALALTTFDVTHMASPGAVMERAAGLLDPGQVTFEVNWLPSDATQSATAGLLRDLNNRTRRNFKIVWPNAATTTASFPAYVTAFNPTAPLNDALRNNFTLQLAGQPVWS